MKRIAPLFIAVCLIFSLNTVAQENQAKLPSPPVSLDEHVQNLTTKLKEDLNLSDGQVLKVKEIFLEFFKVAPPPPPPPPPIDKATFEKAKEGRDVQLKKILSAEQFLKLQELEKKLRDRDRPIRE